MVEDRRKKYQLKVSANGKHNAAKAANKMARG